MILCRPRFHPANVVCLLDNLLHRVGISAGIVCDLHDRLFARLLTRDWVDDEHLAAGHVRRRFDKLLRNGTPAEWTVGPPLRRRQGPFLEISEPRTWSSGTTTHFDYTTSWPTTKES